MGGARRARVALVLVAWLVAFVVLMNLAVVAHGALMIVGIGPLQWAGMRAFGWARSC